MLNSPTAGKPAPGTAGICHTAAFCLLSSAFILFVACPSLSAADPEPSMVQGGGWAATYGGGRNEHANSIQQTSDGGYIVAGWTDSFGTRGGLWVLKLTPNGSICPSCDFIRDTGVSGRDSIATVKAVKGGEDSNVSPRDSSATVQTTNASVNLMCP